MNELTKNIRVLVTRPKHQQANFISICNDAGLDAISMPCIDIVSVDCELKQSDISKTDLILFTSRNAVEFANKLLPFPWAGAKVFAIGQATERSLVRFGQDLSHPPIKPYTSEAFVHWLDTQDPIKTALIIKGIGGRDLIEKHLQSKDTSVEIKTVYERVTPVVSEAERQRIFVESPPHIISVTSDVGLRNLVNIAGPEYANVIHAAQLVVNSDRCAETALRLGFDDSPMVANPPGDEGQIKAIINCLQRL